MNFPILLTVHELSDLFKIPAGTIYYYVSRGAIPYLKIGKHIRFEKEEVINFIKTNKFKDNKWQ